MDKHKLRSPNSHMDRIMYMTGIRPLLSRPMRPKAREIGTQHGGPPDWLEESDIAGWDLCCEWTVHAAFPDGQYPLLGL